MKLPVSKSRQLAMAHWSPAASEKFVSVQNGRFSLHGRPHHFVGANLWCAAYLGSKGQWGNRERLKRELDRLMDLGVSNVRILSASEDSPLKSAVRPAFHDAERRWDDELLQGLDFVLSELSARGLRAVLYLTNFWEWSGGMMTYLSWTNGGHYLDMDDSADPWRAFADFAAQFYDAEAAVQLYQETVRRLVERTNSITGQPYKDDPTIFAWQLCNEPRPGASDLVVDKSAGPYLRWIKETAQLIKALDPQHLVSTGSEGLVGSIGRAQDYLRAHDVPDIDYLTAHIWPQNWGWVTPHDLSGSFAHAEEKTLEYLAVHRDFAQRLGRPLVIEEFGFPRDAGQFDPAASTAFRDRFYSVVYRAISDDVHSGGPLSGSNFWAWGGEGRARHSDHRLRPGENEYLGDPPHEPQ
ncbi:MAG TPA: cellulase family glycosylhydrolase, partial [Polyangiaceae bacterium]|nr:cellulase family glycosylhydrolase [Polyangiaceae bacterium]